MCKGTKLEEADWREGERERFSFLNLTREELNQIFYLRKTNEEQRMRKK